MDPTRGVWASLALVVFCATLAVVVDRPVLLAGAALVGAWVLAKQVVFVRALERTVHGLTIGQSIDRTGLVADESAAVTLEATFEPDSASPPETLTVDVVGGLPTATRAEGAFELVLEGGDASGDRTIACTWPVAGRHRFDAATVTVTDGLFVETVSTGRRPTVTVEPRGPKTVHVGEGGDRITTAYGEHDAERVGSGIEPAEIREYVPGDTASRIDWKATARLATPHVREYEAETDRETLLVFDHRSHLAMGPESETKLEYLREAALTITGSARHLGDPIGLLAVGEEGISHRLESRSSPGQFAAVRRRLLGLEPAGLAETDDRSAQSSTESARVSHVEPQRVSRVAPHRIAARLEGDESRFATALRPLYAECGYSNRLEGNPLVGAVSTAHAKRRGMVWTVVFTDDSSPRELRETVDVARQKGNRVTVLLAPTVLYEPGGFVDVERAYERYVAFEQLRRDFARMDRVNAFEVGPGDRLARVLSAGRSHSRPRSPHRTPDDPSETEPRSNDQRVGSTEDSSGEGPIDPRESGKRSTPSSDERSTDSGGEYA